MTSEPRIAIFFATVTPNPPAFRILCVDDDPRTRRAVITSLLPLGLQVDEASGRNEAVALAQAHRYGLVLMDQVLEDTTGLELIAELKKHDDSPVFALMTGVTDLNLLVGAVNAGSASYVVLKPWHSEELREIVTSAMARASARVVPVVPAEAPPQGRVGRNLALGSAIGLLLATSSAIFWNARHERDDAAALAQAVALLALRSPPEALQALLRDGVAFIAVTEADGSLGAFAIDRGKVQVIGSARDAAIALRDTLPGPGVVTREASEGPRRAEVRVDRSTFDGSNAAVTVSAVVGVVLALSALAAWWIAR